MKLKAFTLLLLIIFSAEVWALPAKTVTLGLDCSDDNEAMLIKQAGGKVTRKSKHELLIVAGGKTLSFKDLPPYDEPLSGTQYKFCDHKAGFFLLTKSEDDLFTGTLINEATGQITPGGGTVMFSPDMRAYLATEQPNGLDGILLAIYAVDGRLSWEGRNYLTGKDPNMPIAYFQDWFWTSKGVFKAVAACMEQLQKPSPVSPDKTQTLTLTKIKGEWIWWPRIKCGEK